MAAGAYKMASRDLKPKPAQVYRIARAALELLELEYPASRYEASELIARLDDALETARGVSDTPAAAPAPDGVPF